MEAIKYKVTINGDVLAGYKYADGSPFIVLFNVYDEVNDKADFVCIMNFEKDKVGWRSAYGDFKPIGDIEEWR